jgi:hypothetical protein
VQYLLGEVVHAREHRGDPGRLNDPGREQEPERPVAARHGQLRAQGRFGLGQLPDWSAAGTGEGADGTDDDQYAHEHAHRAVPGDALAGGVDHDRGDPTGDQDRDREDGDPPGHQSRTFVVTLGHLGRHRDVWHLEERVPGRGRQEQHRDVPGGPAPEWSDPAKISAKSTATARPPPGRKGRRGPLAEVQPSEMRPATGLTSTSHAFGASTRSPATPAAMPSVSVRYGSRSRPGTVPKAPVTSDPASTRIELALAGWWRS